MRRDGLSAFPRPPCRGRPIVLGPPASYPPPSPRARSNIAIAASRASSWSTSGGGSLADVLALRVREVGPPADPVGRHVREFGDVPSDVLGVGVVEPNSSMVDRSSPVTSASASAAGGSTGSYFSGRATSARSSRHPIGIAVVRRDRAGLVVDGVVERPNVDHLACQRALDRPVAFPRDSRVASFQYARSASYSSTSAGTSALGSPDATTRSDPRRGTTRGVPRARRACSGRGPPRRAPGGRRRRRTPERPRRPRRRSPPRSAPCCPRF